MEVETLSKLSLEDSTTTMAKSRPKNQKPKKPAAQNPSQALAGAPDQPPKVTKKKKNNKQKNQAPADTQVQARTQHVTPAINTHNADEDGTTNPAVFDPAVVVTGRIISQATQHPQKFQHLRGIHAPPTMPVRDVLRASAFNNALSVRPGNAFGAGGSTVAPAPFNPYEPLRSVMNYNGQYSPAQHEPRNASGVAIPQNGNPLWTLPNPRSFGVVRNMGPFQGSASDGFSTTAQAQAYQPPKPVEMGRWSGPPPPRETKTARKKRVPKLTQASEGLTEQSLPEAPKAGGKKKKPKQSLTQSAAVSKASEGGPPLNKDNPEASNWREGRQTRSLTQAARKEASILPKPEPAYVAQADGIPRLRPVPQKLLIVLDLNGTLLERSRSTQGITPRPQLPLFLKYCLDHHCVMVWSSATPPNVTGMCQKIFNAKGRAKILAIWARDTLDLGPAAYMDKVQVYKKLGKIWASPEIQAKHPDHAEGGKWDQSNTVLIDDSAVKAASHPYNHVEIPEMFKKNLVQEEKAEVFRIVAGSLQEARRWSDVSGWIREHPFRMEGGWEWEWEKKV